MRQAPEERSRGSILLYALAFAVLVVATWFLFEGNTKSSLSLVWSSIGLSGVALILALASLIVHRR